MEGRCTFNMPSPLIFSKQCEEAGQHVGLSYNDFIEGRHH